MINPRATLINHRIAGLFAITAVCILLLMVGVRMRSNPNGPAGSRGSAPAAKPASGEVSPASALAAGKAGPSADVNDANGPTVKLYYDSKTSGKNPISHFMYFVPLISPTLVEMEISADNQQQAGLVSYERKVTSKSFYVR